MKVKIMKNEIRDRRTEQAFAQTAKSPNFGTQVQISG